jgi:crotonobetainyl-CoA:carnitine CoA-transferase CaiB-like acyl-CoA transferase
MVLEVQHPAAGLTRSRASPARFYGQPPPAPRPPPILAQHQAEVLRDWLGKDT